MTPAEWVQHGTNLVLLGGGAWVGLEKLTAWRRKNRRPATASLTSRQQPRRLRVSAQQVASDGTRPTAPVVWEFHVLEDET